MWWLQQKICLPRWSKWASKILHKECRNCWRPKKSMWHLFGICERKTWWTQNKDAFNTEAIHLWSLWTWVEYFERFGETFICSQEHKWTAFWMRYLQNEICIQKWIKWTFKESLQWSKEKDNLFKVPQKVQLWWSTQKALCDLSFISLRPSMWSLLD